MMGAAPAFSLGQEVEMSTSTVPPSPKSESARLAALDRYAILDTEPEQTFDDIVILAAHVCDAPMAMLSLVDENRQWFKSRVGVQVRETSRDASICAYAIQQNDLFIVPDTLQDTRFQHNPLVVNEPRIRFYAGAPLVNEEGYALGTVCVIDRKPRDLTDDQKQALKSLSRLALGQMELRQNLQLLKEALNDRTREEHARELELKQLQEKLIRVLGLKL
jgi:GAF domain-containing protein